MVERLYVPPERRSRRITLTREEAHHLRQVKRARTGQPVEVFTGDGYNYPGVISETSRGGLTVDIRGREPGRRECPVAISVAAAIPRGKRMDTLVEKLSELGVAELWPVQTSRCVVPATGVSASRYEHWKRIAIESARQSGRSTILRIHQGQPLERAAGALPTCSLRVVASLEGGVTPLVTLLAGQTLGDVAVFVGPEGGFEQEELGGLVAGGALPVSLGPTVLRVETAAIAAAGVVALWAHARSAGAQPVEGSKVEPQER